jgi:hypothetical protein
VFEQREASGCHPLRPYSAATIKAMIEGPMRVKRAGATAAGDAG